MNPKILAAIRQGGITEIVNLFALRSDAGQRYADLEKLVRDLPELRAELGAQRKAIQTIDNYLRGKLEPVCRIGGELLYAYADQCHFYGQMGIAPGDLDVTEEGSTFINPALSGFMMWGVFETMPEQPEIMPPLTLRHFDLEDLDTLHRLCRVSGREIDHPAGSAK